MHQETAVLRDVELRMQALDEARRLRTLVLGVLEQLQEAKQRAAEAEHGSAAEVQYLREAAEASERLAGLRESLLRAEKELRRTAYLVKLLSE